MGDNTEVIEKIEFFRPKAIISLQEVAALDITCKSVLQRYLHDSKSMDVAYSASQIQAVLDYMYEKVNIGHWKEVPPYLRKTITIASYLRLLSHLKSSDNVEYTVKQGFKILDFGLMFGCQLDAEPQLLQKCATVINSLFKLDNELISPVLEEKISQVAGHHNATPIEVVDCPSMEYFYKNCILADKPVVLDNCMKHWPALTKWKDQNYFIKLAGLRTVPIELGSKYTESDWTQKLMTVGDFIKSHIHQTEGTTGYLAQYQLFDQIPELKADIVEPEYCCFSEKNEPIDINAWYGPKGTVSPLHYDPKRNLLAQVIGEKQLYLLAPSDTEFLYPYENELVKNTGRVDPRQPDLEKYPKYKDAKPYYCVLKPGQMLYIPPKWWHLVESLSISFSVSFWWE